MKCLLLLPLLCAVANPVMSESRNFEGNVPPASFPQSEFVDKQGCVFVRVRLDGWDIWVQRLDESTFACRTRSSETKPNRVLAAF